MNDLRSGTCPKCDHRRTLHVTQIADRIGEDGGGRIDHPADAPAETGSFHPWRIARVRAPGETHWYASNVQAVGLVEAFVCAACGFTEFYTRDPERIPVDGALVKEIVGPTSPHPFR